MKNFSLAEYLEEKKLANCPRPLWKLNLSEEDYKKLKATIKNLIENKATTKKEYKATECALYYAEWWRCEYDSGKPSKKTVLESLGIEPDEEKENNLYARAQEGAKILNIEPIRSTKNNLMQRALFLQGGFPLSALNNEKGTYKKLLDDLYRTYEEYDRGQFTIEIILEELKNSTLSKSLQNEQIALTMLNIIEAVAEENDELLPFDKDDNRFDELKQVFEELKNNKQQNQNRKQNLTGEFRLKWQIEINYENENSAIYYVINCPEQYKLDNVNTSIFKVYANNTFIAQYKEKDGIFKKFRSEKKIPFDWSREGIPRLSTHYGDYSSMQIETEIEIDYPELETPNIVYKHGGKLFFEGEKNDSKYILFNQEWECESNNEITEILIENEKFFILEIGDENLELRNKESQKKWESQKREMYQLAVKSNTHSFTNQPLKPIFTQKPTLSLRDTKSSEAIKGAKYEIKLHSDDNWIRWNDFIWSENKDGYYEVKAKYKEQETKKLGFYFLPNFEIRVTEKDEKSATLLCKLPSGSNLVSLSGGNGVEIERRIKSNDVRFDLKLDINKSEGQVPREIGFELKLQNSKTIRFFIKSPFKGSFILDKNNKKLTQRDLISYECLHEYTIYNIGYKKKIEITYFSNELQVEPLKLKQYIDDDQISMYQIKDSIDKLYLLYGIRQSDRESRIQLTINNNRYYIAKFIYDTKIEDQTIILTQTNGNEIDQEYQLNKKLSYITITEIGSNLINPKNIGSLENHNGKHLLPDEEPHKQIILFSDRNDLLPVIPRYYDLSLQSDVEIEERKEKAKKNITIYEEELLKQKIDSPIWKECISYFEIAKEYNLLYSTFDCFKAIAYKPRLMCKFLLKIILQTKQEEIDRYTIDQFEQEFGVAFHWIPKSIWFEEIYENDLLINLSEKILPSLKILFDDIQHCLKYIIGIGDDKLERNLPFDKFYINRLRGKVLVGNNDRENLPHYSTLKTYNEILTLPEEMNNYKEAEKAKKAAKSAILGPIEIADCISSKEVDESFWNFKDGDTKRRTILFYKKHLHPIYDETIKTKSIEQNDNEESYKIEYFSKKNNDEELEPSNISFYESVLRRALSRFIKD